MAKRITCEFIKGATTIEISGPVASQARNAPQYALSETPSGQRWVYKGSSSARDVWTLDFQGLSSADKTALQNFFDNATGGPGVEFTYIHTNEVPYTAKFIATALQFTAESPGWWNVTIEIEVSGRVNL